MSRKNQEAEVELRRKKVAANLLGGLNYRQMAEALGVSIGTISSDVKIILGRWQREQVKDAGDYVQMELVRLDRALNAIWDRVLEGDLKAIETMLKIEERRARLLDLDAPITIKATDIDAAIQRELARLTSGDADAGAAGGDDTQE
jgi:hypothetical protein